MKARDFSTSKYRYKFNGKEADEETETTDYGYRMQDGDLGVFLSIDPITKKYPMLSPYQFGSNRPIDGMDRDGLEWATFKAFWKAMMYGFDALKIKRIDEGFGPVQTQLYTLKAHGNPEDFTKLKETFVNKPQEITNNFWATYAPVQKENPSGQLTEGDEIMVTPAGASAPIFVRVMTVQSTEKSFSMTFATLEGHVESGYVTFSGILNDEGNIEVSIKTETRQDYGLSTIIPPAGRAAQMDQWEDVIGNVKEFLGTDAKGKSKTYETVEKVETFEYDESKPAGKGKLLSSDSGKINE